MVITLAESPSEMNEVNPRSCTKDNALATAIASAISGEKGRLACLDREAIACLLLSRIITPMPAFPISLNNASSKSTLTLPTRRGDHLIGAGRL